MSDTTDRTQLTHLSIADAGAAIRRGDLAPGELTDAYLARIEELDPAPDRRALATRAGGT